MAFDTVIDESEGRICGQPSDRHDMNTGIVIMSAIAQELTLLHEQIEDSVPIAGLPGARSGRLAGRPVCLARCGIGKVNAAVATTSIIERLAPAAIVFTGVAGGLDERLHVGDVIIASRTIQHDAGVFEDDDTLRTHQAGHVPFFNPSTSLGYEPSSDLLEAAERASETLVLGEVSGRVPKIEFGTVLTGDQFVNASATRRRLFETFGAQAVEMEGGAVAQVAEHFDVDCLIVRALSDLAGAESDIDFGEFLEQAAANSARVVRAVLEAMH